ncbi:MAG: nucleotidyltransferase family protein [Bacteroidales bacterium]|jgi:D-glycero-alpha-D-manno-heptose 1-phosphate guanylyltransferase|nr:nucleotidyltransferase family protein [Bacteroidales bacterium]
MITEALILAGGLGTRLKNVVKDLPKPLAPINGVPFLSILMRYLSLQGIKHIILSVGYKHELIESLYGNNFEGIKISYAIESEPFGTGGAIALGLSFAQTKNVLVANGDSFIKFRLSDLSKFDLQPKEIVIVLKSMQNFERYGSVKTDGDRIIAFAEKSFVAEGLINTGVYLANKDIFKDKVGQKFSFEKDFLEKEVALSNFHSIICNEYFIDIGIPEDYNKAQTSLHQEMSL